MEINILFLASGMAMPTQLQMQEKYRWLSRVSKGSIITPVGGLQKYREIKKLSNFNLFIHLCGSGNFVIRNLRDISLTIYKALKIYYSKHRFNIVISQNPLTTGLVALFIAKITFTKVIIEVNGNFSCSFKYGSNGKEAGLSEGIKDVISKFIISFVLKRADGIKLLYQDQLEGLYDINKTRTVSCFHDFSCISKFTPDKDDKNYILFLGFPWLLKGVDILIQSFNKISMNYPECKLKVVGYCPEGKDYFKKLADNNSRIELCDPVYPNDVFELVNHCTLLVLPSRTEAMGRVLLEAMAAKKPVIASNVDGIPTYLKDGYNGLLFESENVDDLAIKLKRLLDDKKYRNQLAENGYRYVHENLSEQCYIDKYKEFIKKVLSK